MSKYAEKNIGSNEEIKFKADFHPINIIILSFFTVLLTTISITVAVIIQNATLSDSQITAFQFVQNSFWTVTLLFALLDLICFIRYKTDELAVTDKRIIGKIGLIAIKTMDMPIVKIQNVSVSYNILGRILKYGAVSIFSSSGEYTFKNIKKPEQFKNRLMEIIDTNSISSQTGSSVDVRYCSTCGASNDNDDIFCSKCGSKLK